VSRTPIYLDHAATTPARPEVVDAVLPLLRGDGFGNPSSPHRFGRSARAAVEQARRQVAAAVRADPGGVVFTSGGTEANNLAVIGAALSARDRGAPFSVAVSAIEHKSVHGAAHFVEELGGDVIEIPVEPNGRIALPALEEALSRRVAVVSVMAANNETGVVQDVAGLAARCAAEGVYFHCDAVQALGKLEVDFGHWGCASVAVSGHKIGAPKGAGALVLADRRAVRPLVRGGGQQQGARPGTENVIGLVGLGVAAELAARELNEHVGRVEALRDAFEAAVARSLPDVVFHGHGAPRVPHVSLFSVPGTDSEAMLMQLDLAGIACSSGSACTTGTVEPSHVLRAMQVPQDLGIAALRFSFGLGNTAEDVDEAVAALVVATARVRRLAGVLGRG